MEHKTFGEDDYVDKGFYAQLLRTAACPVCLELASDPVETLCCSHLGCKKCFHQLIQKSHPCPMCRKRLDRVIPSNAMKRLIDGLQVCCSHKDSGCNWKGNRSDLSTHLKECFHHETEKQLMLAVNVEKGQVFVLPFFQATVTNIEIDWGDGHQTAVKTSDKVRFAEHEYQADGRFIVRVRPSGPSATKCWLDHLGLHSAAPSRFLSWADTVECIYQLGQLGITSLSRLFFGSYFNGDLSKLDTRGVRNMSHMFSFAKVFNQPIGHWDVSSVTMMSHMFSSATRFNQPIGGWNVSQVVDMQHMFDSAESFNQPLGDWDVSNVLNMSYMFRGAVRFNQPLGEWMVSKVTNMSGMFACAESFNQPIGYWNVSSVLKMSEMFLLAVKFNQPLGVWDVSNVTDMMGMFSHALSFNQAVGNWNMHSATDVSHMFHGASRFNQPLYDWDVSSVENMTEMFCDAESFNQPIGDWEVSEGTRMTRMFSNATSFRMHLPGFCLDELDPNNWDELAKMDQVKLFLLLWQYDRRLGALQAKVDQLRV